MKKSKRMLSLVLACMMLLGLLPVTALAQENDIYLNGATGNDSNAGTEQAPVKTFAKAKELATNSGNIIVTGTVTVSDTQEWALEGKSLVRDNSFTTGPMVKAEGESAMLTLKNITLDGGSVQVTTSDESPAPIVLVTGGATLNVQDGTVIQNLNDNNGNFNGAVYVQKGTFNMSGGEIKNNKRNGAFGGGVCLLGPTTEEKAVMNLTGGTISDNCGNCGGGIYMLKYSNLNMNSGTITRNTAKEFGGGIYIGTGSVAKIESGYITDNICKGRGFGGGGIYVNRAEYKPGSGGTVIQIDMGRLYLYNAEIANNKKCEGLSNDKTKTAEELGYDGCIACCASGELEINVTNGAVIHDNKNAREIIANLTNTTNTMTISPVMLGGAPYNWTDKDGNLLPLDDHVWTSTATNQYVDWFYALTDVSTTTNAVSGLGRCKTFITGNSSELMGSAIGCNGGIQIGKSDGNITLEISKEWDEKITSVPDRITVNVFADGSKIGFVILTKEEEWKKTVTDLPKWDSDGNEYTYSFEEPLSEQRENKYTCSVEVTKQNNDGDSSTGKYIVKLRNTAGAPEFKEPGMEKNIVIAGEEGSAAYVDHGNYKPDDTVTFRLKSNVPNYLGDYVDVEGGYTLTFHDELDSHLTYADNLTVTVNGKTLPAPTGAETDLYTVTLAPDTGDGCKFHVTMDLAEICNTKDANGKPAYFSENDINNTPEIIVTYNAKVKKDTKTGEYQNEAWVAYKDIKNENKTTKHGTVTVAVYEDEETISVGVKKVWEDEGRNIKRPEQITIWLLRDNVEMIPKTMEPDNDGNWPEVVFGDQPKKDANGRPYIYTVAEEDVPYGWSAAVTRTNSADSETARYNYLITNKYTGQTSGTEPEPPEPAEPIDLTVVKSWDDENCEDRPCEVTVQLMRDGRPLEGGKTVVGLNASNRWTYAWSGLSGYRDWDVREINIPEGYEAAYSREGNIITITNSKPVEEPPELRDLTVVKSWDDRGKDRPDSVKVTLYNGETAIETVSLGNWNSWTYTWKDLDGEGNWQAIETSIPRGYVPVYRSENGIVTITNTESLIQTGQLNWPVPVLGALGFLLIGYGIFRILKKKHED